MSFQLTGVPNVASTVTCLPPNTQVCLGNVAETCPSPAWIGWKNEFPVLREPTLPPAMTLPADTAEKQHTLDLMQVGNEPRHDSVVSTEGDLGTHPANSTLKSTHPRGPAFQPSHSIGGSLTGLLFLTALMIFLASVYFLFEICIKIGVIDCSHGTVSLWHNRANFQCVCGTWSWCISFGSSIVAAATVVVMTLKLGVAYLPFRTACVGTSPHIKPFEHTDDIGSLASFLSSHLHPKQIWRFLHSVHAHPAIQSPPSFRRISRGAIGMILFYFQLFVYIEQSAAYCENCVLVTSQPYNESMYDSPLNLYETFGTRSKIDVPFPFRWFGKLYDGTIFWDRFMFINFGGSAFNPHYRCYPGFGNFSQDQRCPFNPPSPSLMFFSEDDFYNNERILYSDIEQGASFDPAGWRVRFNSYDTYDLIFLQHGGLQLNTPPILENPDIDDALKPKPVFVAVSDGLSSSFVKTFQLQPRKSYFIDTICGVVSDCSLLPIGDVPLIRRTQPCVSCLKGISPEMTVLFDEIRDDRRYGSNFVFGIKLPFPFRWFNRIFRKVFMKTLRYHTSTIFFGDFDENSVPYSTLYIGAPNRNFNEYSTMRTKRLSVGPDQLGLRLRFEGYTFTFDRESESEIQANIIWEVVFLKKGGLHLCTGWCDFFLSRDACANQVLANTLAGESYSISAVALRTSPVAERLVEKFELHPNSLYTFDVSCAQTVLIVLSVPITSLTGSNMTIYIDPPAVFYSFDNAMVIITLIGAGFSCPSNVSISTDFVSTSVTGTATIITNVGSDPVLQVYLSGVRNVSLSMFTIPNVTTPSEPQNAVSNISFAITSSDGTVILNGSGGVLDAVSRHVTDKETGIISTLAEIQYSSSASLRLGITLSNPTAQSISFMTIRMAIPSSHIPISFEPSAVVITLSGSGWSLAPGSFVESFCHNVEVECENEKVLLSSTIQKRTSASVLTISFLNVNRNQLSQFGWSYVDSCYLEFFVSSVLTPISAQSANHTIAAAVVNPFGSVLAASTKGFMVAIEAQTMGPGWPRVSLNPPLASFDAAMFSVVLAPTFVRSWAMNQDSLPANIIITLAGAGMSCAADIPVMFSVPFSGAAATANLDSSTGVPVLRLTLQSGLFWSGYPILMQFGPCSTPIRIQEEFNNITAIMFNSQGVAVSASTNGTMGRIVGDLGINQPVVSLFGSVLTIVITPSTLLPAASSLYITIHGLILGTSSQISVFSESSETTFGGAFIEKSTFSSLISVKLSSNLSAHTAHTITVSPVDGSMCSYNFSSGDLNSAVFSSGGNLMAASAAGSFHSSASQPTVADIIASSQNGIIKLPGVLFAGRCNCNNTIDKFVPTRSANATVELHGKAGVTTIDCSGTGMRCLLVKDTSVSIVGIVFKGGSSPQFISDSLLRSIKLVQATVAEKFSTVFVTAAEHTSTTNTQKGFKKSSHSSRGIHHPRKEPQPKHTSTERSDARIPRTSTRHPMPKQQLGNITWFLNQRSLKSRYQHTQFHYVTRDRAKMLQRRSNFRTNHVSSRAHRRRLLQKLGSVYSMQLPHLHESETGGCISVLAPSSFVSLSGVNLMGCNAVYGGGAFFNVSRFTSIHSSAIGNTARQGGGMFVVAEESTELTSVVFNDNIVAAAYTTKIYVSHTQHAHLQFQPYWDLSAAAGGGLLARSLIKLLNCSFTDNVALAAGVRSAALGSSMFLLGTQEDSVLSNILVTRSVLKCAGWDCISAGTLFIATAAGITVSGVTFHSCTALAMAMPLLAEDDFPSRLYFDWSKYEQPTLKTYAMGACAVFAGPPSKNASIYLHNLRSSQCTIQADRIQGGCLCFLHGLYSSTVENASAVGLKLTSSLLLGGFLYADDVLNSSIVSLSVKSMQFSSFSLRQSFINNHVNTKDYKTLYSTSPNIPGVALIGSSNINGGVLCVYHATNLQIVRTSVNTVTFLLPPSVKARGLISAKLLYNSRLTDLSVQNVQFIQVLLNDLEQQLNFLLEHGQNSAVQGGIICISEIYASQIVGVLDGLKIYCPNCLVEGGFVFLKYSLNLNNNFNLFSDIFDFYKTRITSPQSAKLDVLAHSMEISSSSVFGGVLYGHDAFIQVKTEISAQNITLKCFGAGCQVHGGVCFFPGRFTVSNISVQNLLLECKGQSCSLSGGLLKSGSPSPYPIIINNISVSSVMASNVSMRCVGRSCGVVGGVFDGHVRHSKFWQFNIQKVSLICTGQNCIASGGGFVFPSVAHSVVYNSSFDSISVASVGHASTAVGTVINVLSCDRLEVRDLRIQNVALSSQGNSSLAVGGSISVSAGSAMISNCDFRSSNVECHGDDCQVLGGFLASISSLPPPNKTSSPKTDDDPEPIVCIKSYLDCYFLHFVNGWADTNNITIFGASFENATLSCSGSKCVSSGGGIFAGVAFRGIKGWSLKESTIMNTIPYHHYFPDENGTFSITAPPRVAGMMHFFIENSSFSSNSITSSSPGAVLAGAGLSFFPSIANITNSRIARNAIFSFEGVAFVGGAGLYSAAPKCIVSAYFTDFIQNSAGDRGSGGGVFAGTEATFFAFRSSMEFNSAGKGGGLHVDSALASMSFSSVSSNIAASQGGGLFCVSKRNGTATPENSAFKSNSTIIFQEVDIFNNTLSDESLTVGASLYVFGAVRVEFDTTSRVRMSADRQRTVLEIVLSVNEDNCIIPSMATAVCLRGTMLSIAQTDVENQRTVLANPTDEYQQATRCYPACLYVPKLSSYTAASGILASCVPCPAGTYSLSNSSNTSDTMSTFCRPCPFGANCSGGNLVQTLDMYWGWKLSDTELASQFLQVPEGYGCQSEDCQSIDSCGSNHNGILCGGCTENYSAAFFTTSCVRDDECATWKAAVLVFGAFLYCFIFSIFLRYQAEFDDSNSPASAKIDPTCEVRSSAFQVLMCYYQLTGLLLTMPNPLKFFDGNALFLNIIGLVFGSVPVSQAFELPSIVFCTRAGSTPSDIILTNMLFYVFWALIMGILSFKRAWSPVFNIFHSMFHMAPEFWELYESACEAMAVWGYVGNFCAFLLAIKWTLAGVTIAMVVAHVRKYIALKIDRARRSVMWLVSVISCNSVGSGPQSVCSQNITPPSVATPAETRGQAWLDFGVAAYSALLSLMVQCTTCVRIQGLESQGKALPELRWFYDGRIVCFSDSGERSGMWQIAALIGVILLTVMPLLLALYMRKALSKPPASYSHFEMSAVPTYVGQFNPHNPHWFTVMFYQRIVLTFVVYFTIALNAPFLRGMIAWFVCIVILVLDFVYKPYANPDMQQLSSICCILLVTMSSVLLRSQSLLSSARPINFDPLSPNQAAETLPFDVRLTIVIILACLIAPFLFLLRLHRSLGMLVLLLKSCRLRLQQKTPACDQQQTCNQKFERADDSTNLMRLPDAAPLVTAGVARVDKSDLDMDIFASAIRNVSAIQAVIGSSAGPLMDGVKPVDQGSARFAVSQRVISSRSGLNSIVSSPSPLARAAVTNNLSVRRQQAAELISHHSDDVSEAPFAVVLFEDIPAAPRSRSKSRALKQTPASISATACVSSSTLPTLSLASSRGIVSAPLTCVAPAVSPPTPQLRSRFRSRDDSVHSSHASGISSAALIPASTAPSAPHCLPAPGVISSATAASPSYFTSAALESQTQRDRARAQRQAVADALAGATRTSDAIARFGDC